MDREDFLGDCVFHLIARLLRVDQQNLCEMAAEPGDCEFRRKVDACLADSISGSDDLPRNEGTKGEHRFH